MNFSTRAIFALFIATSLLGCGKETDQDKIADAQSCLDHATAANVEECVQKVEGMESKAAYLIRCVGKYVEEDFTDPSKIYNSIQASQAGGGAGSMAMMSVLSFKGGGDAAKAKTNATLATSYCAASGSKGLIMLSTMTATATVANSLGGCVNNPTPTCIQTGLANIASDPVGQAAIGSAAIAAYQSNCENGGTAAGGMCSQLSTVVGENPNPSAVGSVLAACYANCPSVVAPCISCTGF